jgi:hypothetical protein
MERETTIPSVSVEVIKEVVPPSPTATGIVAILGSTEKGPYIPTRIDRFPTFMETFGSVSRYSMPEVKQALQNGAKELVIVRLENGATNGGRAYIELNNENGSTIFTLKARADGIWGNDIWVWVHNGKTDGTRRIDLYYQSDEPAKTDKSFETFDNLSMESENEPYLVTTIEEQSELINAQTTGSGTLATTATPQKLNNGANPKPGDFDSGLEKLKQELDVDIVVPSIQYPSSFQDDDFTNSNDIFSKVDAHCKRMSEDGNNRIGFGSVSRGETVAKSIERTETLSSDRFVIVAPHGVVGAVAGLVGNLTYYHSPTFKAISGIASLEKDFPPTDLRKLLEKYIVPIAARKGLGIIIIRGLTTDGDQISVRRVADYAVRNVKGIAERFIGNLNTQDGRDALKQKILEFFQQMEKESAVVPSTDGLEPAFKVDVYSTQRDFALGIVRVDIAVRPVRAIDFIYATILVQV